MPVETQAATERKCVRCGTPLLEGSYWCEACGKLNASPAARIIFALIILGIIVGIGFTKWYVSYLRGLETSLSQRWFTRGEEAMAKNYPVVAIEDYRNALGYEADNPQYRLKLAEALLADGHLKEARAYLLSLWAGEPGNAQVNLDLARLYARSNQPDSAIRYYRTAIDGVWNTDSIERRVAARFEFVQYLLKLGNRNNAVAELIALQSDAPPDDVPTRLRIGQLLLQLDENSRAEATFEALLKDHPDVSAAWSGAGMAALAAGDYHKAERLLTTAVNLTGKSENPEADDLNLVRGILTIDPNLRSLKLSERARRAAANFDQAMNRLSACAAKEGITLTPVTGSIGSDTPSGRSAPKTITSLPAAMAPAPDSLQLLYDSGLQRRAAATAAALGQNPDQIAPTMEFVYEVMRVAPGTCPPRSGDERALAYLAQHDAEEQR